MDILTIILTSIITIAILAYIGYGFTILKEYQRGVTYILGKYWRVKGSGLRWNLPYLQTMELVDTRVKSLDLGSHTASTSDGQKVKFNLSIQYKVTEPGKAVNTTEDHKELLEKSAKSATLQEISSKKAEYLLTNRERITNKVKEELNKETEEWGISVKGVKLYEVETPTGVKAKNKKKTTIKNKPAEQEDDDFLL